MRSMTFRVRLFALRIQATRNVERREVFTSSTIGIAHLIACLTCALCLRLCIPRILFAKKNPFFSLLFRVCAPSHVQSATEDEF